MIETTVRELTSFGYERNRLFQALSFYDLVATVIQTQATHSFLTSPLERGEGWETEREREIGGQLHDTADLLPGK
jgi:hypothetical protein